MVGSHSKTDCSEYMQQKRFDPELSGQTVRSHEVIVRGKHVSHHARVYKMLRSISMSYCGYINQDQSPTGTHLVHFPADESSDLVCLCLKQLFKHFPVQSIPYNAGVGDFYFRTYLLIHQFKFKISIMFNKCEPYEMYQLTVVYNWLDDYTADDTSVDIPQFSIITRKQKT